MEKIHSNLSNLVSNSFNTPSGNLPREDMSKKKWELVYFLTSACNGTCAHCWSSDTFLGNVMPISWHKKYWNNVDPNKLKEVRLSGGETFLYPDLGKLVSVIRESIGDKVPIRILTSGRSFLSTNTGEEGLLETINAMRKTGTIQENVEIHVSSDEHHAGTLYRYVNRIKKIPETLEEINKENQLGIPLLQTAIKNFLVACEILIKESNGAFRGGKIKVHIAPGRLEYHRSEIFDWMDEITWQTKVEILQLIVNSGRAKKLEKTFTITPNERVSLFILPGAEFRQEPISRQAQPYRIPGKDTILYLDKASKNGRGSSILGWWNLIDKIFCGGTAYDALELIGK